MPKIIQKYQEKNARKEKGERLGKKVRGRQISTKAHFLGRFCILNHLASVIFLKSDFRGTKSVDL